MVIDQICKKMSVCNNYVLNKLYILYSHSSQESQLIILLHDYCIALRMSFNKIKSIVFNHFHDICDAF